MLSRLNRSRLLILSILVLLVAGGCAGPAHKPPTPVPPPTLEMADFRKLADRLSFEAVKVRGVENATVILQGKGNNINAITGLTVKQGLSGTEQNMAKQEVVKRLKKADSRVKSVQVTTDPNLVNKIKNIAKAVAEGEPVTDLQDDINSVSRQIPRG